MFWSWHFPCLGPNVWSTLSSSEAVGGGMGAEGGVPLRPPRPSSGPPRVASARDGGGSGAGSGPRCCVTLLLPATGRHSPAPAPAAGTVARTSWGQRARPARAPSLSALHRRPHPGKWGAQPLGSRLSRGPPLLSPRVGTSGDPRTRGGGRARGDEAGELPGCRAQSRSRVDAAAWGATSARCCFCFWLVFGG